MRTVDLVINDIEEAITKLRSAYRKAHREAATDRYGKRADEELECLGEELQNTLFNITHALQGEIERAESALVLAVSRTGYSKMN